LLKESISPGDLELVEPSQECSSQTVRQQQDRIRAMAGWGQGSAGRQKNWPWKGKKERRLKVIQCQALFFSGSEKWTSGINARGEKKEIKMNTNLKTQKMWTDKVFVVCLGNRKGLGHS